MMSSAQGNGELVADLAADCAALGKSQMVGVRRPSAADQARMFGDKRDVFAVADPARLR